MTFTNWIPWIVTAMIATSIEQISHRYLLVRNKDYWSYLVGYNFGAVALVVFLLWFDAQVLFSVVDYSTVALLSLSGLLWFCACVFHFRADQYSEVSLSSLIARLQLVIVCFGGFLIFSETISSNRLLGILIILSGICLRFISADFLTRNHSRAVINPGIKFKLISTISVALAILIDRYLSRTISSGLITLFGFLIPLLLGFFFITKRHQPLRFAKELRFANLGLGALGSIAYFSLIKAVSLAPVTLVFPTYQLHVLLTVALGYLLLNEKEDLFVKSAAAVLVTIGAVIIQ